MSEDRVTDQEQLPENALILPETLNTANILQILSELKGKVDMNMQGMAVTSQHIAGLIQQIYSMRVPAHPVTDSENPVVGKIEPDGKE